MHSAVYYPYSQLPAQFHWQYGGEQLTAAFLVRSATDPASLARPMERAAFVLLHLEGLSIEEIGRALDRHSDAAKNCVFRAVQKLRRALEPVVSSTKCNTGTSI